MKYFLLLNALLPRLPAWATPRGRPVNCAPVHRYYGGFCAGNPRLMPTYARNRASFISVHSHAVAQKLSGRIFVVSGRERAGFWRETCRNALRAPAAVRRTDVMVNRHALYHFSALATELPESGSCYSLNPLQYPQYRTVIRP